MSGKAQSETSAIRSDESARLKKAVEYIARNFTKKITLPEIAREAGMSTFHFHRRFKVFHGSTPKDEISNRQVNKAMELMLKGKQLSAVAKACGFAHQSHFSARFKATTGQTPSAWLAEQEAEKDSKAKPGASRKKATAAEE